MKPNRLALLTLALCLAGCAPPKTEEPAAAPTAPAEKKPPKVSAPKAAPPAPVFDESLLTGREFLLELRAVAPVIRDFELGPLAGAQQAELVRAFLNDAAAGKVDAARVSPRWAAYLSAWAAGIKEKLKPGDTVKAGLPREMEGSVFVPVRTSGAQPLTGWVVLEGGLVSDVQLNDTPQAGRFDPETPQEISSPSRR